MSAPHELPAEIGPYRVVGRLGAGASGQVFRVVDPAGRELALKLLTDPGAGERFAREGQVAASLQHSGIVGVHGQGVTPQGRAYLVFELVEGEDLEAAFRHLAPLELVRVLREVAGALAHAHTRGVVHRDVKPHNVLVDRQGRARVADFGLAHAAGYERLTRSGVMVGTPHYMAPEQVTGERQRFGPATDVWALGVILYRVLTGRLPFDGANMIELAARITSVTLRPPGPTAPTSRVPGRGASGPCWEPGRALP
ncbi:MAG: serine/threonine-protein kinase [Planctomycetota bacterium]